jgi:RNA polymerase sigma factor (sigma-70 family)
MIGTASIVIQGLPYMDEARPLPAPLGGEAPGGPAQAETTLDLLFLAKSGDHSALDHLFARYEARLRRWAHGRLPPAARGTLDTQDLVQETLIRVFQRLQSFDPRHAGAFRDYVWTTLLNAVRDLARKYRRRGPSDPIEDDVPDYAPSPLEEAMGTEWLERYESAMDRLRPEDREAVIARVELGLSMTEVAAALGRPSAAAAHMAVTRALKRLAEEMAHGRPRTR